MPVDGGGTTVSGGTTYYDTYNIHEYPGWNNNAVGMIDPSSMVLNGIHDVIDERLTEQFIVTKAGGYAGNSLETVLASPVIVTEFMWTSVEMDARSRAVAVSNAYLVGFGKGINAMFAYVLYPDGNNEEMFTAHGVPTEAATVLHNLTTILHDAAANAATFPVSPLNVTVTNVPADGMWFLLQKASGDYQVVLWRNTTNWDRSNGVPITIAPVDVTITLPTGSAPIRVFDILAGTTATSTLTGSSVTIPLTDSAKIVDIGP